MPSLAAFVKVMIAVRPCLRPPLPLAFERLRAKVVSGPKPRH